MPTKKFLEAISSPQYQDPSIYAPEAWNGGAGQGLYLPPQTRPEIRSQDQDLTRSWRRWYAQAEDGENFD